MDALDEFLDQNPSYTNGYRAGLSAGWRLAVKALRETRYDHRVDGPKTALHHIRISGAEWLETNEGLFLKNNR